MRFRFWAQDSEPADNSKSSSVTIVTNVASYFSSPKWPYRSTPLSLSRISMGAKLVERCQHPPPLLVQPRRDASVLGRKRIGPLLARINTPPEQPASRSNKTQTHAKHPGRPPPPRIAFLHARIQLSKTSTAGEKRAPTRPLSLSLSRS